MVCGLSGLFTSLLSGTKGGWLSLAMILVMLTGAVTHSFHWVKRVVIVTGILLITTYSVILIPKLPIVDRMMSAFYGAVTWIKTGAVTEGSASIRLESFKAGLIAGSQSPLLGPGQQGAREAVMEAARNGLINEEVVNGQVHDPHNDLISIFSKNGIVGIIGILSVQVGVFLTFWRWRNEPQIRIKALSIMGILLVILYFEFGLSISIFGTTIFRTMYASWAILVAALIYAEKQRMTSGEQIA